MLTGFEPFGRWSINSSGEAVRMIGRRRFGLATAILPVDHAEAARAMRTLLRANRPAVVLLSGLAAGAAFRVETLARPGPLVPDGGPVVRRGRWPIPTALRALGGLGIPVKLSRNAGGYVCETTYWAALGEQVPLCLFVHVPPPGGAWTVRRIARGLEAVLASAAGKGLSARAAG